MLRTITQCMTLLKREDEGTAVTPYMIRRMCQKNEIDFIESGKKYVINYKSLRVKLGLEKQIKEVA